MAMGRAALEDLTIKAKREAVLATLIKNRELHTKIAKEAKAGYAQTCIAHLEKKLAEVRERGDRFNDRLSFSVPLPEDHTKAYDVAIKMLEISVDDLIELNADQVRNFVMDDWDWKHSFIESSKLYSATAASID